MGIFKYVYKLSEFLLVFFLFICRGSLYMYFHPFAFGFSLKYSPCQFVFFLLHCIFFDIFKN